MFWVENLGLGMVLLGAIFTFIGALGVYRMPDAFNRLHASGIITTFGVGTLLLSLPAIGDQIITLKSLATLIFLFLTSPIATHMIARTIYYVSKKRSRYLVLDELGSGSKGKA